MRTTQYLLANVKEMPADAELISHQLMLRAGMIRKLASGLMTWLPTGLKVLRKIENIVREEMDHSGALEILMPTVQPAELWQESQRWDTFGHLLLKIKDRNERDFCYGPTHEEVISDIARRELRSYKQLPVNFYQIQTKFRDEIRPRFGVMRAREFLMKDAYSFHIDQASLDQTYQVMYDTYVRIFTRLGLKFRAVEADSGAIGGTGSHEFQVLAEAGEDLIAYSDSSLYAANIEKATALRPSTPRAKGTKAVSKISTPTQRTIPALAEFLNAPPQTLVKILLVKGTQHSIVAIVLRGDHELNTIKAEHHPLIASPLQFVSEEKIVEQIACLPGFIGPIGLPERGIPVLVDYDAAQLADFGCGANETGYHLLNVNWGRDLPEPEVGDFRNVVVGDASPDGQGKLLLARGIEVGHIFQLGDKYSKALDVKVLNENSEGITVQMGCYGIGVSRLVAAAIEQNHDQFGIIWPESIAPFQIVIIPMSYAKSYRVRELADQLYEEYTQAGYEVLLDDRKERPGVLFASADLLGIPHRVIINESNIDEGQIEYQDRRTKEPVLVKLSELGDFIRAKIPS
jgi:prolyl-tRNA synthetase